MIEEGATEELEAKPFGTGNEATHGQKRSTSDRVFASLLLKHFKGLEVQTEICWTKKSEW